MKKKVLSKDEVKKRQDKIIWTTRIVGVVLFLIGISIIFVTAFIRSRQPEELNDDVVIFESTGDNFTLHHNDKDIIDEEYIILKSIEDYNKFMNELDSWYENNYNNFVDEVNNNSNIDDDLKVNEIHNYKLLNDQRYSNIKSLISDVNISEEKFNDKVFIIIEDTTNNMVLQSHNLEDICLDGDNLTVYFSKESVGVVADKTSSLYFVELDKKYVDKNILVEIRRVSNYNPEVDYKPVIYIYPEEETSVKVSLGYEDKLLVSYPQYENYWSVLAKNDGTLIDNKTGRELYSLYYESLNNIDFQVNDEGFVISEEEIIPFLESKLEILGLNSRESEEFIIYWLPILKKNKYNYIRFASMEEINSNMPIDVEPKPESLIRVLMLVKGLDEKIDVSEQKLDKIVRNGYSVVEWGGTILN